MVNSIGMEFVSIKPGTFIMGSPKDEIGRMPDEEEHRVILTQDFSFQITPVSVGQWRSFYKATGYLTEAERNGGSWSYQNRGFKLPPRRPFFEWIQDTRVYWDDPDFFQSDDHPVTCVTWHDAQKFIQWLSQLENKQYRLPTEAEWEYACRADTKTAYSFGSEITLKNAVYGHGRIRNFLRNLSSTRTFNGRSFSANNWGIFNMHGNVWEWCLDHCDSDDFLVINDTYRQDVKDPCCIQDGQCRILRGGSWYYSKLFCRSAFRRPWLPENSATAVGFRVVLT